MILSICPNPSRDCTLELDSLNVGKLNRVQNKVETYSGKALNVAIGVARLGGDSFATGFMFDDGGKLFEERLKYENVKNKFVWNQGSVRVNYKIIDNRAMLTEINDKGDMVTRDKQLELVSLIKDLSIDANIAIISGSVPRGVDAEFYYEAIKEIPENVKIVVDAEKANLAAALKRNLYLVKPNLNELEEYIGSSLRTKKEIILATKGFLDKGVENVIVSLGADGAILTDGTNSYFCKSASVAVNSTVGAGDSMVAATCVMTERGADKQEILRCAVAAGTASIMTPGTNLFYKDKYDEIYKRLRVEKL
ncbi:MAG: 1-phosphofructokinase family hexose kinase [Clostridia bacterium]|nr:1-phosphofructokinase family hexose kinase [Clostridia bacterium]